MFTLTFHLASRSPRGGGVGLGEEEWWVVTLGDEPTQWADIECDIEFLAHEVEKVACALGDGDRVAPGVDCQSFGLEDGVDNQIADHGGDIRDTGAEQW